MTREWLALLAQTLTILAALALLVVVKVFDMRFTHSATIAILLVAGVSFVLRRDRERS